MPLVDVVIPTFNRHEALLRCLRALEQQEMRDFRVIVVDDGSTPAVSERLAGEPAALELTILRQANGGPSRARNHGASAGESPFIAFLDDDVCADPGLLRAHLDAFAGAAGPIATFGPLLAPPDWRPTPWNRWEAETLAVEYRRMARGEYAPTYRQFFTGNAMVRRVDFETLGGFDERFARAEDVELAYRLVERGCEMVFVPPARGWHYAHRSLASWLAIPAAYARMDIAMDQVHPRSERAARAERELAWRNPATRALRRLVRRPGARNAVVRTAVATARALTALRLERAGLRFLSLAYDLEYVAAFTAARAARRPVLAGPAPLQPWPAPRDPAAIGGSHA